MTVFRLCNPCAQKGNIERRDESQLPAVTNSRREIHLTHMTLMDRTILTYELVVCKTKNVYKNSSTMIATAWTLSLATMALIILDSTLLTGALLWFVQR